MAIENRIILNGKINRLRTTWKDGEPEKIEIILSVPTGSDLMYGDLTEESKYDNVPILVRDQKQMRYLSDEKAAEGDLLEVSGVYNTVIDSKHSFCPECGKENCYDGSVAYIMPLCMELKFLHPKQVELLCVTDEEAKAAGENTAKMMREKKTLPGEIIQSDIVSHENGMYTLKVMSQETPTEKEAQDWMLNNIETSDRIYLMGRLASDPQAFTDESGTINAVYEIKCNGKPCGMAVRSIGEQAESDLKKLGNGSEVFISGSLRNGKCKESRQCMHCGAECAVTIETMYVVADTVQYLTGCEARKEGIPIMTLSEFLNQNCFQSMETENSDFDETENVYDDDDWDDDDDWNDPYPDWVEERFGSDIPDWVHDRWG